VKIVILGAGQVGGSVAHILASEANDVTVVDANAERLQALQDRLDIRTVRGQRLIRPFWSRPVPPTPIC
jgi:trk system potassium uptake protein TrkA